MKSLEKLWRVDELTDDNARRIFDVAFDINQQLNIAPGAIVHIMVTPQAVKFRQLLPFNTAPALDEYETGRLQGCEFLKEIGIISTYRMLNPEAQRVKRQLEVKIANAAALSEIVKKLRARLVGSSPQPEAPAARLEYDSENNILSCGKETIAVEGGSLHHFVCKHIFENRDKKVNGLDIVEEWGEEEHKQSLYDACRALNKKAERAFGIEHMLIFRQEKVWLND